MLEVTGSRVLVVTIQYRLGVFGFLGSEDMRARDSEHGSTGNYGLLDQIESLRWLRDNVGSFGGNSGNVMIFGESAGAGSVSMHLTMPKSFGYGSTNSKNKRRQPRLLSSSRKGEYRLLPVGCAYLWAYLCTSVGLL